MTKIKICGLTNLEDAQVAARAGADFLGFIFYEASPRYVAPETVREIVATITAGASATARPQFVGVFVNASLESIERMVADCRLDAVQLHGDEAPEFVADFQGRGYKAIRPQSGSEADDLAKRYGTITLPGPPQRPALLLDAYHPTLYGGTGHVTNWTMAADIARQYPILLAGSLTPVNVADAIQMVKPWGVDVSSGVEAAKGKKEHTLVKAFIEAVRQTNVEPGSQ